MTEMYRYPYLLTVGPIGESHCFSLSTITSDSSPPPSHLFVGLSLPTRFASWDPSFPSTLISLLTKTNPSCCLSFIATQLHKITNTPKSISAHHSTLSIANNSIPFWICIIRCFSPPKYKIETTVQDVML
ncbi:hypothetical protein E4T42_09263 [Aureobasidium subglaciale]|nr:hypothetical protein E4T42_09263 [Aureobasidium subglaciale]